MAIDFTLVAHALESVMTYVFIGCLGYYLASKGWFGKESNTLISKLLTQVTLPIYLLYNMNTILTRDDLFGLAYGLPVPFASHIVNMAIGYCSAKLLRIPQRRRGVFTTACVFSNTIYIGLPINMALFGRDALPYVLLYYIASTTMFWTIGNYQIASGGEPKPDKPAFWSMGTLRKFIPEPMQGMLIGMLLLFMDARLPKVLANAAQALGGVTTPLVIISIGVSIHTLGFSRIRFDRSLLWVLFSRFVISPFVIIILCRIFPLPSLMTKVFIIQAALPAMTNVAILAAFYNADPDFAAVAVSTTTLAAIVTIPSFMVLATYLF